MPRESWLDIAAESPFSINNIPFGCVSWTVEYEDLQHFTARPAVAIGDHILDLKQFYIKGGFRNCSAELVLIDTIQSAMRSVFECTTLNRFAALGRSAHRQIREYLQEVFTKGGRYADVLEKNEMMQQCCLHPAETAVLHMPMAIGDYTDFYAGKNHAYNVGVMFRGPENALQPNYLHLPVAYHGRASSVVVSGTIIKRPMGQILLANAKVPVLEPCRKLDFELELACFVCTGNALGRPIPVAEAREHIFGYVLMNDWSARDIQAWEYVPLGPFTAKNFGTTISPWVVLADALEPFHSTSLVTEAHTKDFLPYLQEERQNNVLNVDLMVELVTKDGRSTPISSTTSRNLLYSFSQMLAHHTITGCNMKTGDLLGSGTISGLEKWERGALLEITWGGRDPIQLVNGEERIFLLDGDTVVIKGMCGELGAYVGFGECSGRIVGAGAESGKYIGLDS